MEVQMLASPGARGLYRKHLDVNQWLCTVEIKVLPLIDLYPEPVLRADVAAHCFQ